VLHEIVAEPNDGTLGLDKPTGLFGSLTNASYVFVAPVAVSDAPFPSVYRIAT
jgi:hypothetical protein